MNKGVIHELLAAWWLGISALCLSQIHWAFAIGMGAQAWYFAWQQSEHAIAWTRERKERSHDA